MCFLYFQRLLILLEICVMQSSPGCDVKEIQGVMPRSLSLFLLRP